MSVTSNPGANQAPTEKDFFLPDLCTAQSLLVLVVLAELLALLVLALQRGLLPMDWPYFSQISLFCVLVFLVTAALLCPLRRPLARWPLPLAGLAVYLLILVIVALATLASSWLPPATPGFDPGQVLINVFTAALVAGIGLRYLYLTWQLRQREQSELTATIQALQSRIRPHFLFNSLNTIASLVTEDPARAERAVEDLSALFRASLQDSQVVGTWAAERDLCERYLRIEKARLGERLRVRWQVDGVPEQLPMLSLSLQPLIENAIVHGIQRLAEGGEVTISAHLAEGQLQVRISNPLADESAPVGNRFACDNLRHRLQALYGERAQLTLSEDDGHFVVTLRFPAENVA